jgi:hypothetical protein
MKIITNKQKKNMLTVGSLSDGATFFCEGNYYMKITAPGCPETGWVAVPVNAVNLKTGKLTALLRDQLVEPVEADLHITHH